MERQQAAFVMVGKYKTHCILKKHIKDVNLGSKNAVIITDY